MHGIIKLIFEVSFVLKFSSQINCFCRARLNLRMSKTLRRPLCTEPLQTSLLPSVNTKARKLQGPLLNPCLLPTIRTKYTRIVSQVMTFIPCDWIAVQSNVACVCEKPLFFVNLVQTTPFCYTTKSKNRKNKLLHQNSYELLFLLLFLNSRSYALPR